MIYSCSYLEKRLFWCEFCRRLNAELEAKTSELVKEAEELLVSIQKLINFPSLV